MVTWRRARKHQTVWTVRRLMKNIISSQSVTQEHSRRREPVSCRYLSLKSEQRSWRPRRIIFEQSSCRLCFDLLMMWSFISQINKQARGSFISDPLPASDIPILAPTENESSGFEANFKIGWRQPVLLHRAIGHSGNSWVFSLKRVGRKIAVVSGDYITI